MRDPELRKTPDGTSVCNFTVAVNRKRTANNPNPGADYFNVSAWRAMGENCAKYLAKGRKVSVIGGVTVRLWETEGKHGANLEVVADEVEFLSSRNETPAETVDNKSGMTVSEPDDLPY